MSDDNEFFLLWKRDGFERWFSINLGEPENVVYALLGLGLIKEIPNVDGEME